MYIFDQLNYFFAIIKIFRIFASTIEHIERTYDGGKQIHTF